MMRRADARSQERLRIAMNSVNHRPLSLVQLPPEYRHVEGIGYMIGDLTCRFNARSSYIRCAVNPSGPCESCSQYQEIDSK